MKQDKADKIIKKAELKAKKAAQQVEAAGKKAEATRKKQEAQAQKKAAKAAAAATKKAAAKTKKAETVAKKAQLAAQKAEEKKAKAMAKAAAKAVGPEKEGEAGEDGGKKKKSKKKLLLLAIPVVVVAVAAGAFFFLKGGKEEEKPLEPIAPPAEYVLNEAHITALPVWGDEVVVYQEEVPPEPAQEPEEDAGEDKKDESKDASQGAPKEGEDAEGAEKESEEAAKEAAKDAEEPGFTKLLYRYEGLKDPVGLVSAYAAVMTAEDAGFSVVDETLLRIDPPEEYAARGSVQLARNLPKAEDGSGGGVQSLLLSWEAGKCSVILDMPEGRVHDPKPETPTPSSPRRGLSDLESIHPSKLGLPGESMEGYRLIPQEGSFRIANSISTRVNVYGENNQFVGSYFLSADGKLYKLDEEANAVVELDWE